MKKKSQLHIFIGDIRDNWQLWLLALAVLISMVGGFILTKQSFNQPKPKIDVENIDPAKES